MNKQVTHLLTMVGILFGSIVFGENSVHADATIQNNFINNYSNDVKKVSNKYNLYGSVMLSQAAIESGWGQSQLTTQANNFFGIKGAYNGSSVAMPTTEYDENGKLYSTNANFKKYPSDYESFVDNAELLRNNPIYSGTWKENSNTYSLAAQALTGTYATDPNYGNTIVSVIEQYGLDKIVDASDTNNNLGNNISGGNDAFVPASVKYYAGDANESIPLSKQYNKYYLYNHVKGAYKNVTKTKFSKLNVNAKTPVYLDMRGVKTKSNTTWYRIRFSNNKNAKKYWVYKDALSFSPITYKKTTQTITINPQADLNIYNHVYNSNYLAKKTGKLNINQKYVVNDLAIQIDSQNQQPIVWYRIVNGKTTGWINSEAVNQVMKNVIYAPVDFSKTINPATKYKLYNHIKGSYPNIKTYSMSQLNLTNRLTVKINLVGYKEDTKTTWYRINLNNRNYWVYSKAFI
ncbi:glycoside hydrolase family 73 protein [Lentilactobacillus laojiaonis]|uniref:glycoside hydrolase family 73 protein n=1 Tax=Lentilactobacillus laojiaonis TaxID=2883998 RepID=UPI001D0B09CD|nr:glycoside hydrolase family 73 protein [Lentilactobacillus laojiaonis]UDM31793.1 glycoside hydrolase family 73 protein [Lentilactobacillus laojiaonis]